MRDEHSQHMQHCHWMIYVADLYTMHIIGCHMTHFLVEVG